MSGAQPQVGKKGKSRRGSTNASPGSQAQSPGGSLKRGLLMSPPTPKALSRLDPIPAEKHEAPARKLAQQLSKALGEANGATEPQGDAPTPEATGSDWQPGPVGNDRYREDLFT